MKNLILLFICFTIFTSQAQDKKLWAKSVINQKVPKLEVEEWLSEKPETTGKFVLIDFWLRGVDLADDLFLN